MRKSIFLIILMILLSLLFVYASPVYATDVGTGNEYSFSLNYSGDIIKEEDKSGTVILAGTDATPYTNVRIKVDLISGPKEPTIIAYDSAGVGYNIMELGYWGPEVGFAVGGTFSNETPVVATYPEAGTYVIQLALIDINDNNKVIVSKEFTQTVLDNTPMTNEIANNIEEIPQAGISIWVYVIALAVIIIILLLIKKFFVKK